jgi:glycosyltransferase involved in cell wall biosynthesis
VSVELSFADEIIVVDSGSQDGMVAICGRLKFFTINLKAMAQKHLLLKTGNNWVCHWMQMKY